MINIGSAERPMHPRYLRAPGGFAWWYADLVDEYGDGLVLIWSFGLPFLPGYAQAARSGRPQRPVDRPSVYLVLYRRGHPEFYLLQEYTASEAAYESLAASGADGEVRIGRSRFHSRLAAGRRTLLAELDCHLPGTAERLIGTVHIDGVARRADDAGATPGTTDPAVEPPHLWTPLTGPARGEAELRFGDERPRRLAGRAYHDRNGGTAALHELGIDHWMWGRLPFEDREVIYYLLWPHSDAESPRCVGIEIDGAGRERRIEGLRVERIGERRTLGGMPWAQRLRLWHGRECWLDVHHRALADSGPFYLRFLSAGSRPGAAPVVGWGELCYPERVDLPIHRPFVRMKVHRPTGGGSLWVPLFSGPRRGRVRRLLRHVLSPVGG
jgi:carotenoid 1,2-hydratase